MWTWRSGFSSDVADLPGPPLGGAGVVVVDLEVTVQGDVLVVQQDVADALPEVIRPDSVQRSQLRVGQTRQLGERGVRAVSAILQGDQQLRRAAAHSDLRRLDSVGTQARQQIGDVRDAVSQEDERLAGHLSPRAAASGVGAQGIELGVWVGVERREVSGEEPGVGAGDVLGEPGDGVGEGVGVDVVAVEERVEGGVEGPVVRHQVAEQEALGVHQPENLRPQRSIAQEDPLLDGQASGQREPEGGVVIDEAEEVDGREGVEVDDADGLDTLLAGSIEQGRTLAEEVARLEGGVARLVVEGDLSSGEEKDRA